MPDLLDGPLPKGQRSTRHGTGIVVDVETQLVGNLLECSL